LVDGECWWLQQLIYLTTGNRGGAPCPHGTGAKAQALIPSAEREREREGERGRKVRKGKERKGRVEKCLRAAPMTQSWG